MYTTNISMFVMSYRVLSGGRFLLISFSASLNYWGVFSNTSSCHSFPGKWIVSMTLCLHTGTSAFPWMSPTFFSRFWSTHVNIYFFYIVTVVVALSKWKTAQPPCMEFPRTGWVGHSFSVIPWLSWSQMGGGRKRQEHWALGLLWAEGTSCVQFSSSEDKWEQTLVVFWNAFAQRRDKIVFSGARIHEIM